MGWAESHLLQALGGDPAAAGLDTRQRGPARRGLHASRRATDVA
jgi:hypothetical protein